MDNITDEDWRLGATQALSRVLHGGSEAMLVAALKKIKSNMEYFKVLREEEGPKKAVKSFHQVTDGLVEDATRVSRPASCKKGCAHCCYLEVDITDDEAEVILDYAKENDIDINWSAARLQARATNWRSLFYRGRKCVFLSEANECRIYPARPFACRKYIVRGEPEKCNSQKYPSGSVDVVAVNKAEALVSAVYNVTPGGTMPKQLIRAKERQQ